MYFIKLYPSTLLTDNRCRYRSLTSYIRDFMHITSAGRYCDMSCLLVCVFVCSFINVWGQISRKLLEIEARFQWTADRKWHMANRLVMWLTMSCDPLRACGIACAWRRFRSLTAFSSSLIEQLQNFWGTCLTEPLWLPLLFLYLCSCC